MKSTTRYHLLALALSISVFMETLAYTYMQQEGGVFYYSSSILYAVFGIAICFLPLFHNKAVENADNQVPLFLSSLNKYTPHILYLFFISLFVYHIVLLAPLFKRVGIDKQWADMIPSIQLACQRFLNFETVYGPAPEIKAGGIIPYLPLMWIPFLPSVIFNFDPRWTTVSALFLALGIALFPLLKSKSNFPLIPTILTCVSLFLLLNYLLFKSNTFWAMSQEAVVAGFYIVLAFSLLRKNFWLIGLAITGCMLSRYSLLFWVPVYMCYIFFTRPTADFWKLIISFGASMLLLFILPFFIHNPMNFLTIPSTYMWLFPYFWSGYGLESGSYHNVGFYKFFTADQISLMFRLEVITSFIAPFLIIIPPYLLAKRYSLNYRYIVFGSLKISLLFFYGFAQAPYFYLFFVPTIISYVLMFEFLTASNSPLESQT